MNTYSQLVEHSKYTGELLDSRLRFIPLLLLFDVELFEVDALAAESSVEPEVEAEGALAAASSSSCLREVLRFRLRTSLMRLEKKQKHEAYNRTRKC